MAASSDRKARNLWTNEEDEVLRTEVAKQVPQRQIAELGIVNDWRSIAEKLPGRTNKDCRKRWIKLDGLINKGPWSKDEDSRLREGVRRHSNIWTDVSRVVGTRNTDQCAKRWLHFLNPDLNHSAWTEQDDETLLAEVEKNGHNWRKIVDEVLEGRSATDAKNRYTILQRNKRNGSSSQGHSVPRTRRRKIAASIDAQKGQTTPTEQQKHREGNDWSMDMMDFAQIDGHGSTSDEVMLLNDAFDENFLAQQSSNDFFVQPNAAQYPPNPSIGSMASWQDSQSCDILPTSQPFPGSFDGLSLSDPRYMARGSAGSASNRQFVDPVGEAYPNNIYNAAGAYSGRTSSISGQTNATFSDTPDLTHTTTPRDDDMNEDFAQFFEDSEMIDDGHSAKVENGDQADPGTSKSVQAPDGSAADNGNRRSKMVVQNMRPELVGQVLDLLFQSNSPVDVKISSQS